MGANVSEGAPRELTGVVAGAESEFKGEHIDCDDNGTAGELNGIDNDDNDVNAEAGLPSELAGIVADEEVSREPNGECPVGDGEYTELELNSRRAEVGCDEDDDDTDGDVNTAEAASEELEVATGEREIGSAAVETCPDRR